MGDYCAEGLMGIWYKSPMMIIQKGFRGWKML